MDAALSLIGIIMPVIGAVIVAIIGANVKKEGEKRETSISSALADQNQRIADLEGSNAALRSEVASLRSQHRDCISRLEETLDLLDDMRERSVAKRTRKAR